MKNKPQGLKGPTAQASSDTNRIRGKIVKAKTPAAPYAKKRKR